MEDPVSYKGLVTTHLRFTPLLSTVLRETRTGPRKAQEPRITRIQKATQQHQLAIENLLFLASNNQVRALTLSNGAVVHTVKIKHLRNRKSANVHVLML